MEVVERPERGAARRGSPRSRRQMSQRLRPHPRRDDARPAGADLDEPTHPALAAQRPVDQQPDQDQGPIKVGRAFFCGWAVSWHDSEMFESHTEYK